MSDDVPSRHVIKITLEPTGAVTTDAPTLPPWKVLSILDIAHKSMMDLIVPEPAHVLATPVEGGVSARAMPFARKVS